MFLKTTAVLVPVIPIVLLVKFVTPTNPVRKRVVEPTAISVMTRHLVHLSMSVSKPKMVDSVPCVVVVLEVSHQDHLVVLVPPMEVVLWVQDVIASRGGAMHVSSPVALQMLVLVQVDVVTE